MLKVIKGREGMVRKISEHKMVCNLIAKEISPKLSLAVTEASEGFFEKEVCQNSRIYLILEGTAIVSGDNSKTTLAAGDACFISRGTEYEMSGSFKAVVVSHPAFGVPV